MLVDAAKTMRSTRNGSRRARPDFMRRKTSFTVVSVFRVPSPSRLALARALGDGFLDRLARFVLVIANERVSLNGAQPRTLQVKVSDTQLSERVAAWSR
jgi:hypothetical protein